MLCFQMTVSLVIYYYNSPIIAFIRPTKFSTIMQIELWEHWRKMQQFNIEEN